MIENLLIIDSLGQWAKKKKRLGRVASGRVDIVDYSVNEARELLGENKYDAAVVEPCPVDLSGGGADLSYIRQGRRVIFNLIKKRKIPVIFVTVAGAAEMEVSFGVSRKNYHGYIRKPFTIRDLDFQLKLLDG